VPAVHRDVTELSTGAELRVTGTGPLPVICVDGGTRDPVPGTWSASVEWLVGRLAPSVPGLRFAEVRYRVKSWRQLDLCEADARAALDAVGGPHALVLGFSMGGAVGVRVADDARVVGVVGVNAWLPEGLDLAPLRGKPLSVIHGSLDRALPGIPGVSPALSRKAVERARDLGAHARHVLVRGALHAVALRSPWGTAVPMPRAGRVADLVGRELHRLADV
jgi:pimeloyl-ACP methyl ester carboxylesterase